MTNLNNFVILPKLQEVKRGHCFQYDKLIYEKLKQRIVLKLKYQPLYKTCDLTPLKSSTTWVKECILKHVSHNLLAVCRIWSFLQKLLMYYKYIQLFVFCNTSRNIVLFIKKWLSRIREFKPKFYISSLMTCFIRFPHSINICCVDLGCLLDFFMVVAPGGWPVVRFYCIEMN